MSAKYSTDKPLAMASGRFQSVVEGRRGGNSVVAGVKGRLAHVTVDQEAGRTSIRAKGDTDLPRSAPSDLPLPSRPHFLKVL